MPRRLSTPDFTPILEWKSSGLTQLAYCQQISMVPWKFYNLLKRYKASNQGPSSGFIPLTFDHNPSKASSDAVEVIFPSGSRIQFHGPVQASFLRELVG